MLRAAAGLLLAGGVATVAHRAGSLSASGRRAATVMGTLVAIAGWGWAALLIGYFIASSLLTRLGRATKRARTAAVLPDAEARTAVQVFANGGLFATGVLVATLTGELRWAVAGCGALAAAAADTWATELGTLWGGVPRSIMSGRVMAPGESGGVTLVGSMGSAMAASLVAIAAVPLLAIPSTAGTIAALVVAGLAGSAGDSLLGATLQSTRWCATCHGWTERPIHPCGSRTEPRRGVRWMTNDAVNLLATVVGALVALALVPLR